MSVTINGIGFVENSNTIDDNGVRTIEVVVGRL